MDMNHAERRSTFDPTFALAMERISSHHQEAHASRLAALAVAIGSASIRVRLGNALIALGSSLVAPTASRQPSLTD
jgi:hypothetical protein